MFRLKMTQVCSKRAGHGRDFAGSVLQLGPSSDSLTPFPAPSLCVPQFCSGTTATARRSRGYAGRLTKMLEHWSTRRGE